MATKPKTTSASRSAPKAAPAPKRTPAKPAAKAKADAPKAAPKPAAKQNPVAVSRPNGVQTFFRDDAGYLAAVKAVKEGFLASTGANEAGRDLSEKTIRVYHVHRVKGGQACGIAARGPKGFSPTARYLKVIAKSPSALIKFKDANFPHRVLHLCEACIRGLKVD